MAPVFFSLRGCWEMFCKNLSLHFVFLILVFVGSSTSTVEECLRSNGAGYRGSRQVSSTGLTCLLWTNVTSDYEVHSHTDTETGVGDHNHCRNPDSSDSPWCYITGPDGAVQRQACSIETCGGQLFTVATKNDPLPPGATTALTGVVEPAKSAPAQGEVAAVQPVMGISQWVRSGPKKKKDLGTIGYVLGILMMAVIILLGAGITFGYFFKRGRDLKKKHEQHVYEREMQRITLPLSAFSNPTCELADETTIVVRAEQDPTPQEGREGGEPLIGQQAGTPGA